MLKLAGAGLILFASLVYGLQLKMKLSEHVKQLIGLKEILLMLSGEISYTKTPLGEAFWHIAAQGREPFGGVLKEVARQMETDREQGLSRIWKDTLTARRDCFYFTEEEWELLLALGENFGYLDAKMQLNHISLTIQQIDTKIVQAQGELAAKQKVYQCLSILGGLFCILILI